MEQKDHKSEEKKEVVIPGTFRDKGDVYQAISEGLYLNVFRTDRLSVERPAGVIVFKL